MPQHLLYFKCIKEAAPEGARTPAEALVQPLSHQEQTVETIPRSTLCVQQHLSPAAQFFNEDELADLAERGAFTPTTPEPGVMSEADWARSDAILVAMETERAIAERISGKCERCDTPCDDLIGYCSEGICGDCAVGLVEVAS